MSDYQIRQATRSDSSEILELLRVCLGDSTIPRTAEFWEWKHFRNPFGISPAVVAVADDRIVALRTFLRWRWKSGAKEILGVRAVDTATHPDWQGKGIFSKLTLHLMDQMKKDGVSFVYNTPNNQSKPGYLKMGWEQIAKLPLWVRPLRPFHSLGKALKLVRGSEILNQNKESFETLLRQDPVTEIELRYHTSRSEDYFKWRYEEIPGFAYHSKYVVNDRGFAFAVYRQRKRKEFLELSIAEFMVAESEDGIKMGVEMIQKIVSEHPSDYMIAIAAKNTREAEALKRSHFFLIPGIGPSFIVHPLNLSETDPSPVNWNNWRCSLGDLEMF